MQAGSPIGQRWDLMRDRLDERQRRALAAAEAKVIGRGGVSQVAPRPRGWRVARSRRACRSSKARATGPQLAAPAATRRPGGGRKPFTRKDPTLVANLLALVEPTTRGDPESPLRWSCKSLRVLAEELQARGHVVSHVVVGQLLKTKGFSLQGNAKVIEGNQSPDRNAQFEHINATVSAAIARGHPLVSKGGVVTDAELATVRIEPDKFHGDWNYRFRSG